MFNFTTLQRSSIEFYRISLIRIIQQRRESRRQASVYEWIKVEVAKPLLMRWIMIDDEME